jgi:hypothetical protein
MFLSLTVGPTGTEILPLLPCCCSFSAERDFPAKSNPKIEKNSNGDGILQIIYRWKALTEENSLKQLFWKMVYCTSLALEEKRIG